MLIGELSTNNEFQVRRSHHRNEEGTPERSEGGEVIQLKHSVIEKLSVFDLSGRASRRPSPPRQGINILGSSTEIGNFEIGEFPNFEIPYLCLMRQVY